MTDLKGYASESLHMAQRQAIGPLDPQQPASVGYLADIDIANHSATVVDPMNSTLDQNLANPNDPVNPVVTTYLSLPTQFAGLANGQNPIRDDIPPYGLQYVPFGGAGADNPTDGEQISMTATNADIGAGVIQNMHFNDQALPPGSQPVPVSGVQLANGEHLMITPAGIVIHLDARGNVNLYTLPVPHADANTTANIKAISQGGISIQATANPELANPVQYNINVNADASITLAAGVNINLHAPTGQVNINAPNVNITSPLTEIRGAEINAGNPGVTYAQVTALIMPFLLGHTHSGVFSGFDESGPPVPGVPPCADVPPFITESFAAN